MALLKSLKSKNENVITVEGYTDDLLAVSESGEMKQTRLFYILPEVEEDNTEALDITITSTNPYKYFPIFNKLIGKKIRISVDVIE